MEEKVMRISRKALYAEVWSTPMTLLSKKYRMSDVGLAKICRKYDIPRPGRGYWAKLQHGKKKHAVPLSKLDYNPEIAIWAQAVNPEDRSVIRKIEKVQVIDHVPVPDDLRNPHLLVKETMRHYAAIKNSFTWHGVVPSPRGCLNIKVTKDNQRRALLLMDTLLKALEARGYRVFITDKSAVSVTDIRGQLVGFEINELLKRIESTHSYSKYEFIPSGKLCIKLLEQINCRYNYFKNKWADTDNQRLEEQLGSVIAGMVACSEAEAKQLLDNEADKLQEEADRRRRAEEERYRQELALLKLKEQARIDRLMNMSEDWQKSKRLREFLLAFKVNAEGNGECCAPESDLGKWLDWANRHATNLDPLAKNPTSILDRN